MIQVDIKCETQPTWFNDFVHPDAGLFGHEADNRKNNAATQDTSGAVHDWDEHHVSICKQIENARISYNKRSDTIYLKYSVKWICYGKTVHYSNQK